MAVNQLLLQVEIIRCPLYETPELILKILITYTAPLPSRRSSTTRTREERERGIYEESLQKMSSNGTSRLITQDEKHGAIILSVSADRIQTTSKSKDKIATLVSSSESFFATSCTSFE